MKKSIVLTVILIVIGIITYFMFSIKQDKTNTLDFGNANTQFRNAERTNLSPYAMFGDSSVVLLTDAEKYGRQFIEIFNTDKLSETYKIEFDQKAQKIRFYNKKGKLLKEELLAPEMIAKFLTVDPRAEKYAGWSPYNYVMGNPIRNIDPNGDTVRIVGTNGNFDWTPGSSYDVEADAADYDAFIAESVSALNALTADETTANFTYHMRDRDVVLGNAILDYVGKGGLASKLITIKEADPHSSRHESGIVYWMPTEGMRMEHYKRGVLASVPPMMVLLHEMGHGWLEHTFGDSQLDVLFADEERMIIENLESKASLSMGFGRRDDHYNVYDNRDEALRKAVFIDDPKFPESLRERKTYKYYYQTQSATSVQSAN